MRFYLDSDNWEADYYISNTDYMRWNQIGQRLHLMYLDNASAAGFANADNPSPASYRGHVPGCDRTMLLENGVIDDLYFGRNLDHSRWAENFAWAFRRTFKLPKEMKNKKRIQLHFCGIDYQASFVLNNEYLGDHMGMFMPVEFDVTDFINRDGDNLLAVLFEPIPKGLPDHPSERHPGPSDFADFHRPQMSFGWDWARGMGAAGIWDHVYLQANDDARIKDCFFRTKSNKVTLEVETIAQKAGRFPLKIQLEPIGFKAADANLTKNLTLEPGDNTSTVEFTVENPELWYPVGYGKQPLYLLTLTLDGEVTTKKVAFRTLEMRRNPGSADGAYNLTFTFNGQPVFARGQNWVPTDLLYCRTNQESYDRQVRLAAEAGINIFRVWGGGIVEKEEFYDACDRYGVIVWQEFLHACSNYRKDPEYLAIKKREAEAILRKLRNHVSVSMICGGNEVQYYFEIPDSPLYIQYREMTEKFAPDLPFHTSSPDRSRPGERHHGPWNFMMHKEINPHDRLLASELGCNGFPELESVKKFIPECDLERPESQSWKYHFAIPCRSQDWHKPEQWFTVTNADQRFQASMFAQSDICAYWMNHCRRKFPHTTGCFFWQYNEPWPTLALATVDYYTLPKMVYYRLARVHKNVTLALKDDNWCCIDGKFAAELYAISDLAAKKVKSTFRLVTMDGKCLLERSFNGDYVPGGNKLADLTCKVPSKVPGGVLLAELRQYQGNQEIFNDTVLYGVPDFKQAFTAPRAKLQAEAKVVKADGEEKLVLTLHNDGTAAIVVRAALTGLPITSVYWRDNYITVSKGETRTIEAALTAPCPASAKVKITGWNIAETTVAVKAPARAAAKAAPKAVKAVKKAAKPAAKAKKVTKK